MREAQETQRYNQVARDIMQRHGIPINDLHALALPKLTDWQQPHNVHFTKEGSLELAKEVARHIRKALSIQP